MTTLTRVEQTLVYAEPLDHPDPAFLLFLLIPATSPFSPPDAISIAEAWTTYLGYYVLVPATPPDETALASLAFALQNDAAFATPALTGFAWSSWDGATLQPPVFLPIATSDGVPAIAGPFPFGIGSYGIEMQDGSPVAPADEAADTFFITYAARPGFPPQWGIGITIPTSGPVRFCLLGEGLIGDLSGQPATGFDVSLKYFTTGAAGTLDTFTYPIFAPAPPNFFLIAGLTLDPLTKWWKPGGPLKNRTSYTISGAGVILTPGENGAPWTLEPAPATQLTSNFRTVDGDTILLAPVDVTLVPQPLPGQPGGWYLVPQGTFAVTTATMTASPSLLCGLSGTESISIAGGTVLGFTPGQPAYAPGFPIINGSGKTTSDALLTATIDGNDTPAVTAWMSVITTPASVYTTQPQTSPLFVAGDAPNVLPLLTPPVATLDATTVFPMVPYAGCMDGTLAPALLAFEQQILAPRRQEAMPAAGSGFLRPAAGDPFTATTPQGLLVTIDGSAWTSLILASTTSDGGALASLSIEVTQDLQTALSSANVFLVITDPVQPIQVDGTLAVAGWPFSITLGPESSTILIFKFCAGSLQEMAAAPPASSASRFNSNPTNVQAILSGIISAAAAQVAVNPADSPFNIFLSVVTDPNWNGILALSVPLSLAGLPPDMAGLAAGINAADFEWHHLGVNVSRVSPALEPQPSSIFGLINYAGVDTPGTSAERTRALLTTATAGGDTGFSFRVLTLMAEFENSQIIAFQSTIALTITTLLGESVQLQLPAGAQPVLQNSLVLQGHLETRVAADGSTLTVYVFSGSGVLFFLTPASAIFYYISVTQSEFSTLQPPSPADSTVLSQFRLWGTLDFQVMPGLDIFSFGDVTPPSMPTIPVGLAYSGLNVNMTFDINDPAGSITFALDSSAVAFDPASSTARPDSLYAGLPLSLDSLWSLAAGGSAAAWLPVNARALETSPPDTTDWYAITNVIDLGTMGALASLASFNALLVVMWTPGGPEPSAGLMMQLPGTSAGKTTLTLQDVVRIDIGQIVIPESAAGEALQLLFNNIGVTLFGLKLPVGASLDLALGGSAGQSLGWYTAYIAGGGQGP